VAALLADEVEPSEGRRERAVAAMAAEVRQEAPAAIPRRRWLAASLAAAVFLALTVPFLLPQRGLTVERLDGAAVLTRSTGESGPLKRGDRVRPGDRLETQGVVWLEGKNKIKVTVHKNTAVLFKPSRLVTLKLESGAVRVDSHEVKVAILDPKDRRAEVIGSCEARFQSVLGHPRPTEKTTEFQIRVTRGRALYGAQSVKEGQTMTVSDEGTLKIEDAERKQP
jgi:hypothetical protein